MLKNWEIDEKVSSFVTDTAENMKAAIRSLNKGRETEYIRLDCAAHLLNLVVGKFFPFQKKKKKNEEEDEQDYLPSEDEEDIPLEIPSPSSECDKLFNLLVKTRRIIALISRSSSAKATLDQFIENSLDL